MNADQYLQRTGRLTAILGAVGAAVCALAWDWRVGLGVALGALLAHVNLMMIARTLGDALGRVTTGGSSPGSVGQPEDRSATDAKADPNQDGTPPSAEATASRESARVRAQGLLRLPFVVLALVLILWYMPARPEGVALGVTLSLAAAVLAALRSENRRSAPSDEPPA